MVGKPNLNAPLSQVNTETVKSLILVRVAAYSLLQRTGIIVCKFVLFIFVLPTHIPIHYSTFLCTEFQSLQDNAYLKTHSST